MTQTTNPSVVVYEVAPYGDVSELLTHSTTRHCLIRQDSTVIEDLSLDEANLFAGAANLLALAQQVATFWNDPLAFGDEATVTRLAGQFAPLAYAARNALAKVEGRES